MDPALKRHITRFGRSLIRKRLRRRIRQGFGDSVVHSAVQLVLDGYDHDEVVDQLLHEFKTISGATVQAAAKQQGYGRKDITWQ